MSDGFKNTALVVLLLLAVFFAGGLTFSSNKKDDKEIKEALLQIAKAVGPQADEQRSASSDDTMPNRSPGLKSYKQASFGENAVREHFGDQYYETLLPADRDFYNRLQQPPSNYSLVILVLRLTYPDGRNEPVRNLKIEIENPKADGSKASIMEVETDSKGRLVFVWPRNQPFKIRNWGDIIDTGFTIFDKPGGEITLKKPHYIRESVAFIEREIRVNSQSPSVRPNTKRAVVKLPKQKDTVQERHLAAAYNRVSKTLFMEYAGRVIHPKVTVPDRPV